MKYFKIILLSIKGFGKDRCKHRAYALTYLTMLSIVPVAAVALGIAKGFGLAEYLEEQIAHRVEWQSEVVRIIFELARSLLEEPPADVIAAAGFVFLIYILISVMGHVEKAFNDIWKIRKSRHIARKFADYFSMIVIGVILFALATSSTVILAGYAESAAGYLGMPQWIFSVFTGLLSWMVAWLLFSFLYAIMPNTSIPFAAGLAGGIAGGTLFQLVSWAYVTFQISVSRSHAVYGSFASLPLFMVWLHASWMAVLFGAEVSCYRVNVMTYGFSPDYEAVNMRSRKLLALQIMNRIAKDFSEKNVPPSYTELSVDLEIPLELTHQIVYVLIDEGLISEACEKEGSVRLRTALPPDEITVYSVLEALERHGPYAPLEAEARKEFDTLMDRLEKLYRASGINVKIADIGTVEIYQD